MQAGFTNCGNLYTYHSETNLKRCESLTGVVWLMMVSFVASIFELTSFAAMTGRSESVLLRTKETAQHDKL